MRMKSVSDLPCSTSKYFLLKFFSTDWLFSDEMAGGIAAGNAAGTPTNKARERLLRRGPM